MTHITACFNRGPQKKFQKVNLNKKLLFHNRWKIEDTSIILSFYILFLDDKLTQIHLWQERSQDFKQYYMSNNTIILNIILYIWISRHSFENASAFIIALLSYGTNGETEVTNLKMKFISSNLEAVSTLVHSFWIHDRNSKIPGSDGYRGKSN